MKRFFTGITLLGLLLLVGSLASSRAEDQAGPLLRVCSEGCPYQQIQAAINAAPPLGGVVLIAPGRYQENLVITKSVTLLGTGDANQVVVEAKELGQPAVLFNPRPQPESLFTSPTSPVQLHMQSLTLTGARQLSTNQPCARGALELCPYGLYIVRNKNEAAVTLVDVQIENNEFSGIEIQGHAALTLIRSRISKNGLYGLSVNGFSILGDTIQVALYGSEVSSNQGDGVHLSGESQLSAFDSRIVGNTGPGISDGVIPSPSNFNIVLQRVIIQGNSNGIAIAGGATLNISDSSVEENRGPGIAMLGSLTFISAVRVTKNSDAGIVASGVLYLTKSVITENGRQSQSLVYPAAGPGVELNFRETQAIVIDNEIRNNAGFGITAEYPENIETCVNNKVVDNGLGSYNQTAAQKCK